MTLSGDTQALITAWSAPVLVMMGVTGSGKSTVGEGLPEVTFVFLEGDTETLSARLAGRRGHFMPSSLLASQLDALEPPSADERAITVPIERSVDHQVVNILRQLTESGRLQDPQRGALS